ncbi:MAG TPA: M10 family metallopeptidase C-terminal domain-containing protein [Allosphingosinicella sp.]|nr:M10 family metallopeptidase C-terminal domain-containing protein [Allosphingosinicella sp.]
MAVQKLSKSITDSDGVLVGDGVLIGDAIVRSNGVLVGDGVLIGDLAPFRLTDFAGIATFRGKPIATPQQVINQIDSGARQPANNGTVTFTFLDGPTAIGLYNSPKYQALGITENFGYSEFSAAQKAVAREAMILWDDLVPLKFVEKNGNGADIQFANTTTGPAQAHAYYPSNGLKVFGDVWVASPSVNWTNAWLQYDGYGRETLIHEIGHSLGLSHPGNYNFGDDGPDPDTLPDPISYLGDAFYAQDSLQYTIMSYFSPTETGAQPINAALFLIGGAQTPLLDDILTIQSIYGADPTTRVGNTNYFSNSNAGNAVYDLAQNPYPYLSVYDAGGEDTFDFSTANRSVFIDLRPGAFSSAAVGAVSLAQANSILTAFNNATDASQGQGDFPLYNTQAEVDADANLAGNFGHNRVLNDTGVSGIFATSHRNISIAYNTTIENANGGSARDYLYGNDVANKLNGNGGNDVLDGAKGNDILSGGAGADEFRVSEIGYNDKILDFATGVDKIRLSEIDADSSVAGNQAFTFIGNSAFSGAAGQLRSYVQGGENYLAGDVNGDGLADFTINTGAGAPVVGDLFL